MSIPNLLARPFYTILSSIVGGIPFPFPLFCVPILMTPSVYCRFCSPFKREICVSDGRIDPTVMTGSEPGGPPYKIIFGMSESLNIPINACGQLGWVGEASEVAER